MSVITAAPARADRRSFRGFLVWGLGRLFILPLLCCTGLVWTYKALTGPGGGGFFDFKGGLWQAGVAILHGRNPYHPAFLAHQAAIMHAGGVASGEFATRVFSLPLYPAPANLAVIPLSLLPFAVAAAVYSILAVGAMALAIWLLGVRDWRCHAAWLLSWPFLFGMVLGTIGPFLVLGTAIAWRWRDRFAWPALAVGALVAIKLFPWTLGAWLLVTRRYKTLALAIVSGLVLVFGGWAIIGFRGLDGYAQMLSNASYIQENRGDSIAGVLVDLGTSAKLAQDAAILAGLAILALAWRTYRRPDGDRRAFGLAILASLISTPIVWDHYMVLLFVPIALLSPRFSKLWLIPMVTPTLTPLAFVFVHGPSGRPTMADSLPYSCIWLAAETVLGFYLCTTEQRRAALAATVRAHLGRRSHRAVAVPLSR